MQHVDSLILARWVLPVEPEHRLLEHHSVAVHEGRIIDLLPSLEAKTRYTAAKTHSLPNQVLMPGLVNTHTHAAMSLFRGLADDLGLMDWLKNHIWPAEGRWVNEEFVRDGVRLAVAEMLRSGTTCYNDMYFFPDETARVSSQAGIRSVVGLIVIDMPTVWAGGVEEYLSKGLAVHDQFRHEPLVRTAFAPHSPYAVSDDALSRIRTYADELDIPVHMHVHETTDEISQSLEQHGERPLARLKRLGLLSERLLAVHMTQLETAEIGQVAASGATVVHCPESNLKLASGFCPLDALDRAGARLALGTDGAASNNNLDMLGEIRTAALLAKGVSGSATALAAERVVRMATIDGARALGMDDEIGSIEIGKAADLIAVDLGTVECNPVYNPVSQIVYASHGNQVSDVWVAGQHLLNNRELTTLDTEEVLVRCEYWREHIARGH